MLHQTVQIFVRQDNNGGNWCLFSLSFHGFNALINDLRQLILPCFNEIFVCVCMWIWWVWTSKLKGIITHVRILIHFQIKKFLDQNQSNFLCNSYTLRQQRKSQVYSFEKKGLPGTITWSVYFWWRKKCPLFINSFTFTIQRHEVQETSWS